MMVGERLFASDYEAARASEGAGDRIRDRLNGLRQANRGAADFVSQLIVSDPESRLTAKQALEHSWFRS